jgi:hypothetical protein
MIVSALLLFSWSCEALSLRMEANPIRKVVTLLQDMQKEIQTEGEVEQKNVRQVYVLLRREHRRDANIR